MVNQTTSGADEMCHCSNRIQLVRNPTPVRDGLRSYGRLLQKFNIVPTHEGPFTVVQQLVTRGSKAVGEPQFCLIKRRSPGHMGTVTVDDIQNDCLYLAPVEIGTPPQKFQLDFDTGSADFWIWSTRLGHDVQNDAKGHHTIFDPKKSSTWKDTPGTWQIQYGDGSTASGNVGTDDVTIGSVLCCGQTIQLAKNLSPQFQKCRGDGLLGMAFGSINTVQPTQAKTPICSFSNQIFTACLGSWRDVDEDDGGASFYTVGCIDQDMVKGKQIQWTHVDDGNGLWQVPSTSMMINNKRIFLGGSNTAVVDTGTSLALLDDDTVKNIYDNIPGSNYDSTQQGYVFPANLKASDLPCIQLSFGDHYAVMQKEDLGYADAGHGMVYGSIQSRGQLGMSIYGDAVLKSIYCIFDQGRCRFGFVQRDEKKQNLSVPRT